MDSSSSTVKTILTFSRTKGMRSTVLVGRDLLTSTAWYEYLASNSPGARHFIVSDPIIASLYGYTLLSNMLDNGLSVELLLTEPGEMKSAMRCRS